MSSTSEISNCTFHKRRTSFAVLLRPPTTPLTSVTRVIIFPDSSLTKAIFFPFPDIAHFIQDGVDLPERRVCMGNEAVCVPCDLWAIVTRVSSFMILPRAFAVKDVLQDFLEGMDGFIDLFQRLRYGRLDLAYKRVAVFGARGPGVPPVFQPPNRRLPRFL